MAQPKKSLSEASKSKETLRKTYGETSGAKGRNPPKTLRQKLDRKTKMKTVIKSTSVLKQSGPGSILHYIYHSTLGQSLHSQMRRKGAGDFIGGMKFSPTDPSKVFLASGDGTLTLQNFDGHPPTVLSRVQDCGHDHHNVCLWYCCVDVSLSRQMLLAGDNMGRVSLLGIDGQEIFNEKLHKAKVTHGEFNPRCDWLLATASVDHTVKLWDLRKMKDKNSYLHEMMHDKAVNSAFFNPVDCSKLLTTDQYDQIRVYSSSDWSTPQQIIQHPHRQFQHLTPIKATWHPMYDLIVVGRYPDERVCPGDLRTIDVYDANTGEVACQLLDHNATGIVSVNKFSPMGDVLGSGMGVNILVWNREETLGHKQLAGQAQQEDVQPGRGRGRGRASSRSQHRRMGGAGRGERQGEDEDNIGKLKKKLAFLEESSSSGTRARAAPSRGGNDDSKTRKGKKK
ncbi:DNA damage-binding protein 2 isoform X2 [Esox lucius]|uniref:DNA damage-binding protein 2 isoform X2 n=1 Tax=Esox lucius TaxID=8010 RepID=UPI0014777638|nr:DNA damage-binding protein 2 isoform X2 [Esox lucius]